MKFTETHLKGSYIIELEPVKDERGFFARTYCKHKFKQKGLALKIVQSNMSFNEKKGTLRGMHYQAPPMAEAKLVSCVQGSIYDVIIDLRRDSPTYCRWFAVELCARKKQMLFVPEGFAHGFQTLEDNTMILYQMSEFYAPEYSRGVRWNDPVFGIRWPIEAKIISEKDRNIPDFER